MDIDFWLERWETGKTGFHLAHVNPCLQRSWSEVHPAENTRVLVPLCGKSQDLHWLAQQGQRVLGCEWSRHAVAAFFEEAGLRADIREEARFTRWVQDRIEILCGDFFDLIRQDTGTIDAFYDRASLIALPDGLRQDYARHLAGLLRKGTRGLLITLDYRQECMEGPPFAVPAAAVERLFGEQFRIRALHSTDVLEQHPRFVEKGLAALNEEAWLLIKR